MKILQHLYFSFIIMKIKIQEIAINNFDNISEITATKKRLLSNLIDINSSIFDIIKKFETQANFRSSIKKPGIKVNIKLIRVMPEFTLVHYQQLLLEYIQGIGWDDLQYIGFIHISSDVEIDIIFNRVISSSQAISLRCIGANWRQYKIIEESYEGILESQFLKTAAQSPIVYV
ncbi:hypothetical protein IQ243_20490 [Nostocales cyanobacterium LEGE 11386]|nr:hypothetical protein [Nostocales cyanobacterium LEGE 11386]